MNPRATPRWGPTLREASFLDYPEIARLEARHGFKEKGYEEWSHLWVGNPVYRELHGCWSIGWVIVDGDNHIVAALGSIPLLYELEGRRILAASSRFWVADPEYRSASLMLLDRLIHQPHVDLFLSNTVSAASAAAVDSFECRRVPVGVWNESAFWVTNYRGFLESFLTLRSRRQRSWDRLIPPKCPEILRVKYSFTFAENLGAHHLFSAMPYLEEVTVS